jgi:hypothetical protein
MKKTNITLWRLMKEEFISNGGAYLVALMVICIITGHLIAAAVVFIMIRLYKKAKVIQSTVDVNEVEFVEVDE